MTVTTLDVTLVLALAVVGPAAVVCGLAAWRSRFDRWARRAVPWAFAATSLPLAVLVLEFLTGDLGLHYVWAHTAADYPWWLRLAGVWGGQEGTFLLWAWVVLGASTLEGRRAAEPTWPHARAIASVVALLLLVPALVFGLGTATADLGLTLEGTFAVGGAGPDPLTVRPHGQGLNPLLESVYMAVHPPVQFAAYGLTVLVASYALAHLARGGAWRDGALRWARLAWIAFAAALFFGGLWAYNVLSFGGYWAWDPVETADLVPFLALTVFLHSMQVARRQGHLGLLAPAAGAAALVLVVFATFITRTGLWASVHAFLPTGLAFSVEDPGARLVAILAESAPARYATGLLVLVGCTFAAAGALAVGRAEQRTGHELTSRALQAAAAAYGVVGLAGLVAPTPVAGALHRLALALGLGRPLVGALALALLVLLPFVVALVRSPAGPRLTLAERAGQLTLAAYLLLLVLLATWTLLVLGVNGYERAVYDARLPYLAAPVLALQTLAFHVLSMRGRVVLAGVAAVAAGILLAATGSFAWAAAPLALAALSGPVSLVARRAAPAGPPAAVARAACLVVAGLAGLVQWASPGTLPVLGVGLASPAWYVPMGLAGALVALAAPLAERADRWPRWLGPAAALASVGYGLGAALGATALVLSRARAVAPPAPLRKAAAPLVHAGVALVVLGVALSTYAQATWTLDEGEPLERGVPRALGPWTVELVGGRVADQDANGLVDVVEATFHVRRGDTFVTETTARLEHSFNAGFTSRGAFVPHGTPIARTATGDLVLDADPARPLAVRVRGDNATWVVANSAPPSGLEGEVDALATGIAYNPGVNLVWGGALAMLAGATLRLPWDAKATRT